MIKKSGLQCHQKVRYRFLLGDKLMADRLESDYKKNISKKLKDTFSYKNVLEIPKL